MSMSVTELFEGLKKKKYRTAFALYSPAEDDLPPEVQKWYLDFTRPEVPIVATWRPTGIVNIEESTLDEYKASWMEYTRQCKTAITDTYGWSLERKQAVNELELSETKDQKRFWTSFISVLDFQQVDTRIYWR